MTSGSGTGQLFKGKVSAYTITKQLHQSVWLAVYESLVVIVYPRLTRGFLAIRAENLSVRYFRL